MKENVKYFFHLFDVRKQFILSFTGNEKVLELGCGRGNNGIYTKKVFPSIKYYGVDVLSEKEIPDFINYKIADLEHDLLPFPSEYFDAILFTHVIEHLKTTINIENEIRRVLKNGGKIYVETLNWTTLFVPSFGFHREQHNPFNFFDDPSHIKPWSKHGIFEFLFKGCSFAVVKVGTVRNWLRIPIDFIFIIQGLIIGKRVKIITSFWNIFGFCIYGIGEKK